MKKINIALGVFMMCMSYIHANEFNSCCCGDDTVSSYNNQGGFYLGLTGSLLVPAETGLGHFTDSWQYHDADGGITARSKPSRGHYDPSGAILVGYDLPCSANNIEVEYFHLYNSKHNYNDTSDGPVSFGSVFFNVSVPLSPGDTFISDAFLKYTLDQIDTRVGHRFVAANGCLQLRPSLGVRWTELKHDLTFLIGNVRSHYWGAGPMIALDTQYSLCKGFSFTSHFDAAVLVGTVKASSLLSFGEISRFRSPSTYRAVPSVTGKLGIAYEREIWCRSFRVEAGYQAGVYVGAFDTITGYVGEISSNRIASITTSNFSYSGPYISINFHM